MKTVIIDNYDSFTYNLKHIVKEMGAEVKVIRNDCFQLNELEEFDKIILSPGPGIPSEAGLLLDVIKRYSSTKPILGICLGEQAIAEAFNGTLINLENVFHGIKSEIDITGEDYIFNSLPKVMEAGRYHSWIVNKSSLPDELEITAISKEGYIMGLKHRIYDVHGIQFHPESILTPFGKDILRNFIYPSFN